MTEAEKKSFFAHTTTRAPGKRQIKPTAAVLDLVLPADDEEDDEDFIADKTLDGSDDDDDDDGSESGSGSDAGVESGSDDSDDCKEEDESGINVDVAAIPEGPQQLICSLCLNLREAVKNEEVMQCDRCGLAVHDSCYLPPDIGEDAESTQSSSSTEPWFCEPCIYGLIEPPHCELCPIRHGAFKRSDIGGRWVHLICALYTRGITFGDIDHLGAVSWQEMDHRNFGRKSCSGCTNKLEARTGVATRCELGMCKEYFHTTCAQRLGLLVDHSEDSHLNAGDESQTVEPRYINCKKHSNTDDVRLKRIAFNRFLVQEEKRMLMVRRKVLTEREERKRLHALRKHDKRNQSLIGITICWPDASWDKYEKKIRRGRQLHTSARYLEAFKEKAELIDVDKEQFEQEFLQVKGESLPFLSPGFSDEFVGYFHNREHNVFAAERKKLDALKAANIETKKKQEHLLSEYNKLEQLAQKKREQVEKSHLLLQKMYDALINLGVKKIKKPDCLDIESQQQMTKKKPRNRTNESTLPVPSTSKTKQIEKITLHICKECTKTSDQHLLIGCDSCHNFYHLGCLDPPLEKMPRKVNCDWYCSACCGESDGDEGEQLEHDEIGEDSSNDGISNRKLRQRSDSTKAKRMAEAEEQTRAYKAAIAAGGRNMQKRGRSLGDAVINTKKLQKRRTIDTSEPTINAKKQKGPLEKSNGNKLNGRTPVLSNVSLNASGRSGKTVRGSQSGRSSRVSLRSEDLGLGEDSFVVLEDEIEEEL